MSENPSVTAVDALLARLTAERPIMAEEHYGIETRQEMLAHLASFSAYLDSYDEWWESAVARIKAQVALLAPGLSLKARDRVERRLADFVDMEMGFLKAMEQGSDDIDPLLQRLSQVIEQSQLWTFEAEFEAHHRIEARRQGQRP